MVKVVVKPAHTAVDVGVIVRTGAAFTVTELMADVVLTQPLVPVPMTEYELVFTGDTVLDPEEYV